MLQVVRTDWDYTKLAESYLRRPDYAKAVIDAITSLAALSQTSRVCDVGAGVAHLTLPLAQTGCLIDAVEPNDAMRALGQDRTSKLNRVQWYEGSGEQTGRASNQYQLVSFGSSFNVCDQVSALREVRRILVPRGWFTCIWNHRDLTDPIQAQIEAAIVEKIPDYEYGVRRADQGKFLEDSKMFEAVLRISSRVNHTVDVDAFIEGWRSHATLARQAGKNFESVVSSIGNIVRSSSRNGLLEVPYETVGWIARVKG